MARFHSHPWMLVDDEGIPLSDMAGPLRWTDKAGATQYAKWATENGNVIYRPVRYKTINGLVKP